MAHACVCVPYTCCTIHLSARRPRRCRRTCVCVCVYYHYNIMVIGLRARCERARRVELHQGFTFILRAGQTGFSPTAREKCETPHAPRLDAYGILRCRDLLVVGMIASRRLASIDMATRLPEQSLHSRVSIKIDNITGLPEQSRMLKEWTNIYKHNAIHMNMECIHSNIYFFYRELSTHL